MPEYLEKVTEGFPYAYTYLKVIKEVQDKHPDFIFLDMNRAFEELTGLHKKQILNKRVTMLFQKDWANGIDWLSFFYHAALRKDKKEMVFFSQTLCKHLKITAYTQKKDFLSIILQEVLTEEFPENLLEKQKEEHILLTQNFDTVFNTTHDAMFIVKYSKGEFRYIRNNAEHQRLSGFSTREIFGKTPIEVMGKESGLVIQDNYQRCVDKGKSIIYEQTIEFPVGKSTWVTTLTPIYENDSIRYLVGSGKDITDYISIKHEREELLERFELMFNQHTACMFLMDPDSGKILDVNPSACAFYGYSKDEFLQMNITEINPLPAEENHRLRMLAFEDKQNHFVFPHRLKSGKIRTVEVYSCPVKKRGQKQLFSIVFDVTDRERYREELYNEKELLRITLHSIGDGVVTTDIKGKITGINQAAQDITGWTNAEVQNISFQEIFPLKNEETGKVAENPIEKVLVTGKMVGLANHTCLTNKYGKDVPIADSAAPIRDEQGKIFGTVMVFRDVSIQKEQEDRILFLSYHDQLTGLYNRRYAESMIDQLTKERKQPITVIMGDVNGLKITNDVFGHPVGDILLQSAARAFKKNCRKGDILARWGGDEFVLILPQTPQEEAEKLIKKIRKTCAQTTDSTLMLSISLGYAIISLQTDSFQQKLQEAEEQMYHQKLLEGKSYRNTIINTLLATLNEKSMETEEHAQRMQHLCRVLGEKLHLSQSDMNDLGLLSILHDIGKVGVPQNILKKPGPLTPEEWKEMKKHSEIGYRIAQTTPELAAVAEYILSHHERWDGNGYPSGIKGKRIPLLCRILAVADAYDAMTNDRIYRKAICSEEAQKELVENSGTQFDPEIVKLLIEILHEEE